MSMSKVIEYSSVSEALTVVPSSSYRLQRTEWGQLRRPWALKLHGPRLVGGLDEAKARGCSARRP
jgi:hypothetical protein